jgi:hypothetical protein
MFLPRLVWTHNSPVSASQVAGMTDMSHCTWPTSAIFLKQYLVRKIKLRIYKKSIK